jgi:hypothetical protein
MTHLPMTLMRFCGATVRTEAPGVERARDAADQARRSAAIGGFWPPRRF